MTDLFPIGERLIQALERCARWLKLDHPIQVELDHFADEQIHNQAQYGSRYETSIGYHGGTVLYIRTEFTIQLSAVPEPGVRIQTHQGFELAYRCTLHEDCLDHPELGFTCQNQPESILAWMAHITGTTVLWVTPNDRVRLEGLPLPERTYTQNGFVPGVLISVGDEGLRGYILP